MQQACKAMLDSSGILEIEERVLNYLYAHRGSVKLMATVDDIARLLQVGADSLMQTSSARLNEQKFLTMNIVMLRFEHFEVGL